jgi:hypothetical protein
VSQYVCLGAGRGVEGVLGGGGASVSVSVDTEMQVCGAGGRVNVLREMCVCVLGVKLGGGSHGGKCSSRSTSMASRAYAS